MRYTIYFHDMVGSLPENIDENEQPVGECFSFDEGFTRFLNKDIKMRFMPDMSSDPYKEIKDCKYNKDYMFEIWLNFEAKNDEDAKSKVESVLEDNGFEWVSVYYLLQGEFPNAVISSEGIVDEKN